MRKYLAIKNAMITSLVAVMYYKAVFADVTLLTKIIGTLVISVALMNLLQMADRCYMKERRKEKKNGLQKEIDACAYGQERLFVNL